MAVSSQEAFTTAPPPPPSYEEGGASDDRTAITALLADLRAGRREAFDQMLPLVYHELRRAARRELAVRPSDTLSTTAFVHELYLKLSRADGADWQNRAHFLAVASVAMRHILVDRARRRTAEKRGGPHRTVTLDDALVAGDTQAESVLELHDALEHLATLERTARTRGRMSLLRRNVRARDGAGTRRHRTHRAS